MGTVGKRGRVEVNKGRKEGKGEMEEQESKRRKKRIKERIKQQRNLKDRRAKENRTSRQSKEEMKGRKMVVPIVIG